MGIVKLIRTYNMYKVYNSLNSNPSTASKSVRIIYLFFNFNLTHISVFLECKVEKSVQGWQWACANCAMHQLCKWILFCDEWLYRPSAILLILNIECSFYQIQTMEFSRMIIPWIFLCLSCWKLDLIVLWEYWIYKNNKEISILELLGIQTRKL